MKIINVNTLEPQKDSYINKDLEESFSDLLFKVDINEKEGYLYFLFEHKSYEDKGIAFQLLKYMVEIWKPSPIKRMLKNCQSSFHSLFTTDDQIGVSHPI